MRVLVVHDRSDVGEEVSRVVSEAVEDASVDVADDGMSARTLMKEHLYDVAVIDLTIPHIKGRTAVSYNVADELLAEIFEADTMNAPGDIIGITRESDAAAAIKTQIGPHLMAIIHEDDLGSWRELLADRIKYAKRTRNARLRSLISHYDYDVAIITALDKERSPYEDMLGLFPLPHFPGVDQFLFEDNKGHQRRGILKSVGRAGQVPTASEFQAVLTEFRPSVCFLTGFCGGLSNKVDIGDVLIADSVFDWDFGKWEGSGNEAVFVPRPEPIVFRDTLAHRLARSLVSKSIPNSVSVAAEASRLSDGRIQAVNIKQIPFASGSAVVADARMIPRIKGLSESIGGVDMESYGFSYAASHTPVLNPEFFVIKTVADFCDVAKDDKDHAACCVLSARVAEAIMTSFWDF